MISVIWQKSGLQGLGSDLLPWTDAKLGRTLA
jgi:hypothetical protein